MNTRTRLWIDLVWAWASWIGSFFAPVSFYYYAASNPRMQGALIAFLAWHLLIVEIRKPRGGRS